MNEDIVIPGMFFLTVIVLALGVPLVRAYVRRVGTTPVPTPVPADLTARLDRIEASVETIAVEVERLSEGQRFTTRLLSEGAMAGARVPQRMPEAVPANSEVQHG